MMRKISVVILGLIMFAILGSSIHVAGENTGGDEMCVPMGNILLEPPESVEAKKSSVDFPHTRHFSFDCRTCHHQWEGDSQIQTCTVSGCHDLEQSPIKAGKEKIDKTVAFRYYKIAFHKLCISCHKKMKIENKKKEMSLSILTTQLPNTGPTGCIKCHPKE